jgi:lipopolysaccharide transport system ATP-binding protein
VYDIGANVGIVTHVPGRIEFTYWNYVPDTVLNVSMLLNNSEEVCVYNVGSGHGPRPAGIIRHTLEIPGDFLNTGSYYINVIVVKDASVGILFQNNVVAFEVTEGEVVGNWYGRIPGSVRPKLKWKTDTIESSDFTASTAREHD